MCAAAIPAALQAGGSILSGVSSYNQAKSQARAIKSQAELEAKKVTEEGEDVVQQQKQIATGGGYVLDDNTSPLQIMLETERQYKEDAANIMYQAKRQAKQVKKAGLYSMIGSFSQAGASFVPGPKGTTGSK